MAATVGVRSSARFRDPLLRVAAAAVAWAGSWAMATACSWEFPPPHSQPADTLLVRGVVVGYVADPHLEGVPRGAGLMVDVSTQLPSRLGLREVHVHPFALGDRCSFVGLSRAFLEREYPLGSAVSVTATGAVSSLTGAPPRISGAIGELDAPGHVVRVPDELPLLASGFLDFPADTSLLAHDDSRHAMHRYWNQEWEFQRARLKLGELDRESRLKLLAAMKAYNGFERLPRSKRSVSYRRILLNARTSPGRRRHLVLGFEEYWDRREASR